MKKCKVCKGTGFTFTGIKYVDDGWFGLRLVNEKETCRKCYGKGRR